MTGTIITAEEAIARLRQAAVRLEKPVNFMEVCGTHTVSAFRSGLHSIMPDNVKLLSGPGCPVCVTSQGDIDQIVELSFQKDVTLCTYGDMIRVTGAQGSLADARASGADVRVVYSTMDAVKIAQDNPQKQVVFAAVGFETTAPASAAAVLRAQKLGLNNFTILASHKLVMPALRALLDSGSVNVDGFVCPGHVSVITGYEIYRPIVEEYRLACVVTGFEGVQIAAALARLVEIVNSKVPVLENLYPQAVGPEGNAIALAMLEQVFTPATVYWRGIGELPASGLVLREAFSQFDAHRRFTLGAPLNIEPPGCRCGEVITGRTTPDECRLFGTVCTPINPIGPCMVSGEGTCQAWFKYRRAKPPRKETA